MIIPDQSIEVAFGEVSSKSKGTFAWKVKLDSCLSGYDNDPKEREQTTIDPKLVLMGTNLECSYQDGNTYVKGRNGTLRVDIPYEAIDGLIAALKEAKAQVPNVVNDAYKEFDEMRERHKKLNNG